MRFYYYFIADNARIYYLHIPFFIVFITKRNDNSNRDNVVRTIVSMRVLNNIFKTIRKNYETSDNCFDITTR